MDACHTRSDCAGCPGQMICHCLQVTEEMLLGAVAALELRTLRDLREATGAGDGCTACHRRLRKFLDENAPVELAQASSSPI